ncbi:hypothetical protein ISU10_22070 [Nocardioides agariphilus]|uniref:Uncharacterized protein n=1 Tax=Nocardioides agariphilus TaxID=433664 RepID=A0A930VMX6_9ACTN|nr:hypothetical protein [Nocardioides agariphilus]MBF4770469.1 hypothetical protein [Nocardioides agariphilus]
MADQTQIVNYLVRAVGVTAHDATAFVEVIQEIVEEHVTDDVSVIAPPLMIGRFGCPVLDRLMMRLQDPRWAMPESVDVAPQELADQLRLPVDVIEAYPVVGKFGLLAKVLDRLAIADEDAELYLRLLDAWLSTFADHGNDTRDFEVQPTGSREAFRGWLLDRFEMLGRYGYAARVADSHDDGIDGRVHSFDDGRRPDLIARITADGDTVAKGDWLVIQHKTTAVGHNAHDELATHVDWLRAELASQPDKLGDAEVHGLLIADGVSLLLERALRERAFGYISLSSLGYRHWVRSHTRVAVVGDPDSTAIAYPAAIRLGSLVPAG